MFIREIFNRNWFNPSGDTKLDMTFRIIISKEQTLDLVMAGNSTPEDHQAVYDQFCLNKREQLDNRYHNATYSIIAIGILNGYKFKKEFESLDAYKQFLESNNLLPKVSAKLTN
jgi:hypothetical protein